MWISKGFIFTVRQPLTPVGLSLLETNNDGYFAWHLGFSQQWLQTSDISWNPKYKMVWSAHCILKLLTGRLRYQHNTHKVTNKEWYNILCSKTCVTLLTSNQVIHYEFVHVSSLYMQTFQPIHPFILRYVFVFLCITHYVPCF